MFSKVSPRIVRTFVVRPVICLIAMACAMNATNLAYADDLPTGEQVMEKYIEKTGGKKAYDAVKTRIMKLNVEGPGQKMKMTFLAAPPNKMTQIMDSEMMGEMRQGYDGEHVWMMGAMTGVMLLTGPQADMIKSQADFDREYNWKETFEKVECTELIDFHEEQCYKVKCTGKDGSSETQYFSKESGLMIGKEQDNRGMSVTTRLSDYRKSGDLLYPHKIIQGMPGMGEFAITVESVEFNKDIPDETFMPAEVKAKIAEQSGGSEKKTGE